MNRVQLELGEASDFEVEHGVYAQAVDDSTVAYAPVGWKDRAIPLRVGRKTALCMDLHDLMLSKYGAGREFDREAGLPAEQASIAQRCSSHLSGRARQRSYAPER